ncbi:uncharacterized protein LOC135144889 [Zophobas morio]|uniref:uncharacterized protein LOC135144889 n=1 Tax=Zophobas morio TaxID=2755281 RepID=UPI003083240D
MLFETATVVAKNRDKLELVQRYEEAVQTYKQCSEFPLSVIRQGTRILNTHKVTDSYIGDYALIDAVTSIHNSTLLSSLEDSVHVTSGAYVDSSIIQWGCSVETMAVVSTSLLCEHSYAKSHAKVSHSVVAPNSGVSGGECTSSLLGPFVGFHHQALLIAALWPEGKGNVGYGANVGSNHTSKAPDQEIWPGEGVFYGLGCSIKYPTNMSEAPYSVIASGVCTLPQRVAMPFSLINSPSTFLSDVSPALNEIIPGWVLKENIYAVLRNERKFQERNKARRNIFDTTIFRPIIAGMLEKARAALMQPRGNKNFPVFLEGDIAGIGKNYLTEINRKQGIEVYTFYLRFYALQGLYFRIKKLGFPKATSLEEDLADPVWMHQRSVIIKEFPEVEMASPFQLLHHYKDMLKKIGESALISKQRDDQRGMKIFPDYKVVHVLAEKDSFVNDTLERIRLTVSEIREWESLSAKNE